MNLFRLPDSAIIECDGNQSDEKIRFEIADGVIKVFVTAEKARPKFIKLRWNETTDVPVKIYGDAWERSYADLAWRGFEGKRIMPWYFLATYNNKTFAFGVETGTNSFVSFTYDAFGVSCNMDIRCGSHGVNLSGRELLAGILLFKEYSDVTPFDAMHDFCTLLCKSPLSPKSPVYGGNNWYYAYGKSTREEILSDASLQVELSRGNNNRPYMVIDDCWEINQCQGPWEPNEAFGDMKSLAYELKKMGVQPGIWVRFLHTSEPVPNTWRFNDANDDYLDPSVPEVLEFIKNDIKKIREWGYTLIKHDFSTKDIFGLWGKDMEDTVTNDREITFHDNSRTSAEIVLDLYRAIRSAAGDSIIIGCNTISHLSAGLCEVFRIGDDTSGKDWNRTLQYGVNTLAFRLPQHKAFYDVDADCVGILGKCIPWELNSQWLDLLAESSTPLFVSCPAGILSQKQKDDLHRAYKLAEKQEFHIEPIDWLDNNLPCTWKTENGIKKYTWK